VARRVVSRPARDRSGVGPCALRRRQPGPGRSDRAPGHRGATRPASAAGP